MSVSEAVLRLIFEAENLAGGAVDELGAGIKGVADQASAGASRIAGAFRGMGDKLANGIGNAVETLSSGGSLTAALAGFGVYMAGQMAESMAGNLIEKLAESGLVAAIAGPLGAIGSAAGSLIAAAIPIGMALLPVLLVGAIVAAVVFLINNPEIVNKIVTFASDLIHTLLNAISGFLSHLPEVLGAAFAAAWGFIVNGVIPFIGQLVDAWMHLPQMLADLGLNILHTIIDGLAGLPGAVAKTIGDAFASIHLDIGPFHITGSGVTVDLPHIDVPHFASGVQNFAGGLAVINDAGPELVHLPSGSDVIPSGALAALMRAATGGGGPRTTIITLNGREIARAVEGDRYYQQQRNG